MRKSDVSKKLLEKAALELFIKRYKELYGITYKIYDLGDKPDGILEDSSGNKVGVEVVHVYCNDNEAMCLLRKKSVVVSASSQELIRELNNQIEAKQKKMQDYNDNYPLELLIRVASPIFTMQTLELYKDDIIKPGDQYRNIWILIDQENTTERWTGLIKVK